MFNKKSSQNTQPKIEIIRVHNPILARVNSSNNRYSEYYATDHARAMVSPNCIIAKTIMDLDSDTLVLFADKLLRVKPDGQPANYFTEAFMAVSQAVMDPDNWKLPVYARRVDIPINWVVAVLKYWHGTEPIVYGRSVYSDGYSK